MTNPIPAAIYARVSTEEQAKEGFSIRAQIEELETYAKNHGMDIVERYIDNGASGKSIAGRQEMTRLLKDIEKGTFKKVIVYKIDRIARNSRDAMEIAERCQQADIGLISLKENFDIANPAGKMMFQMMSNFAEFERNTINDRLKMGMIQRAKQGLHNGGRPLGYNSVNKMLVINEEEAHVVRMIFNYAEQELGYKAIVNRLNDMGYKTKKGKLFSVITIRTILDNPIYIGKIRYNLYEKWTEKKRKGKNDDYILVDGQHEAIIEQSQWDRVQQIRKKRGRRPTQSTEPYLLTGLVKCPVCGTGMTSGKSQGSKGKKYRYYICRLYQTQGKEACKAHSVPAGKVEQHVFDELKRITAEPYVIKKIIKSVNEKRSQAHEPITEELRLMQKKLSKVETQIKNIINELMDDPSLKSIFKPKLEELTTEKESIEAKIEELNEGLEVCDTTPIDDEALYHLLSNFDQVLQSADPEQQKSLFHMIIKEIHVTREAPRNVTRVDLHFDFTIEGLQNEGTGELLHTLNTDFIQPVDNSVWEITDGKKVSEAMSSLNILPLKYVRFIPINPKRSVNLFK
ncbi:recombinase family protein [Bacillus shivajii]|uniref:recombinase family protein n=1 Tax=Bacillus shivajii TaxID=1983719 RepID=UPI001CFA4516|nr:recombinase family protein [Bacillus shivajii]UCZ53217.1 recombinase family protein [Bacillus shivajii]